MHPIIRNILAIIAGILVGSTINMLIITISPSIIPPPEGVDVSSTESLKQSMHLFEVKHFLFPFLAHALGTFFGALTAALLAKGHPLKFAMGIAVFFLIGGIASVFMLPSPLWFTIVDLSLAYFPMAYLGGSLARKNMAL